MPRFKDPLTGDIYDASIEDAQANGLEPLQALPKTNYEQLADTYIKPVVQGVGAGLGATLGAPLSPVGSVAGAGLGYAGGGQLYKAGKQLVSDIANTKPLPPMPQDKNQIMQYLDENFNTIRPEQRNYIQEQVGMINPTDLGREGRETLENAIEGATYEMGGQVALPAAKALLGGAKSVGGKLIQGIYGAKPEAVGRQFSNPQAVKNVIEEGSESFASKLVNNIKNKESAKISALKTERDALIDSATGENTYISVKPLLENFNKFKSKLDPIINKQELDIINNQIDIIKGSASQFGGSKLPVKTANNLKKSLQELSPWNKPTDAIGNIIGNEARKAIKSTATVTKKEIEKAMLKNGVNRVGELNNQIKQIIDTGKILKNPLSEPNIVTTLGNLGNDAAKKNFLMGKVKKFDKLIGTNLADESVNVLASKTFKNPDSISSFVTGRSVIPSLPFLATGNPALIGGAMVAASPMVLKGGIAGARGVANVGKAITNTIANTAPARAGKSGIDALMRQDAIERLMQSGRVNPVILQQLNREDPNQ